MEKSESIKNLAIAMSKAQSEMTGAAKSKTNPFFKAKYADLKAVIEAIKTPFANNELSYVQFPIEEGGRIGIETILMHSSGEWLSNSFTVQLTKQDAQGAGSAITYCRRYGLQAVAGIPSEDDDGNAASKKAPSKSLLSAAQVKTIKGMLSELIPESVVCGVVNVNKIEEILASDFEACVNWIKGQS